MKNLKLSSGSPFSGSPIVYSFDYDPCPESTASFYRAKFLVKARLSSDGTDRSLMLSMPLNISGGSDSIDISSALRAVADNFYPKRTQTEMPRIIYSVQGWVEYLFQGTVVKGTKEASVSGKSALVGTLTDLERITAGTPVVAAQHFSRKPVYGEVVALDETFVYPISYPVAQTDPKFAPKLRTFVFSAIGTRDLMYSDIYNPGKDYGKEPISQDYLAHSVYVVPPSPNRHHFYFLNTLGCIETISAYCLSESSQKVSSTTDVRAVPETLRDISRISTSKKMARRTYKMSSGPVTEDWQEWWLTEFLMTPIAWMLVHDRYLPCNIIPGNEVVLRKESSDAPMEILFSVELAINGSPML